MTQVSEINQELLNGCKFFMAALESGMLVRDITKDAAPDWSIRMMEFVRDLSKVQLAITNAEAQ